MGPRVIIHTLGCKVNQYDGAMLHEALEQEGFRVVAPDEEADAVVVNTCTVTSATDRQNRQLIRRLRKANPKALMLITGCQAEAFPEALEGMPEVDLVLGNKQKEDIPRKILQALHHQDTLGRHGSANISLWQRGVRCLPGHTRAFLKVQDGCDAQCAYCIVPRARGPSRSRPPASIVEELRYMAEAGIKEVVITGVHLGKYGRDLEPPWSLTRLLWEILERCALPRIRLSSIEPLELGEDLLHCMMSQPRVCPHLHVPLQSGDDEVLRSMNRPYRTAQYLEKAEVASGLVPDLTWGCDVMVGFPGETPAQFRNTVEFLGRLPLTYIHVFPFSPRPGTVASKLPHRVPPQEVKARSLALREISLERRKQAMASYVGRELTVLAERPWKGASGWIEGLTHNYLRVRLRGGLELHNEIVPVRLVGVEGSHLLAERL